MFARLSRRMLPDDADPIDHQRAYILVLVFITSAIVNPIYATVAFYQNRVAMAVVGVFAGVLFGVIFFLAVRRQVSIAAAQLVVAFAAVGLVTVYLVEEEFRAHHAVFVIGITTILYMVNMPDILTNVVNALLFIALTVSATVHAFDDTVTTITTGDLPWLYLSTLVLFVVMVFVVRGRRLLDGEYRKNLSYVKQQREFEAAMQQFLFHELRNPLVVAQGALREAGNIAGHHLGTGHQTSTVRRPSGVTQRDPSDAVAGEANASVIPEAEHLIPMETLLREGLSATHSMEKLLTDVQTVLQLRAGEYNVVCEAVPVQSVVQSVLSELDDGGGPQLAVEWRGGEAMSTSVKTDTGALVRVLRHLLTNARKFGRSSVRMVLSMGMGQGGEAQQLGSAGDDIRREYVSIEVRNDGAGMDEAALAEAFDLFQVRSHRRGGGSGLGLVECKLLTEAMGASLSLTSVVDGETCAVVLVPVWDDERDGAANRELLFEDGVVVANDAVANRERRRSNPLRGIGRLLARQHRLRVLFVDDVPMNRVVGVRMLMAASENMGRRPVVDVAGDGKEAVEKFKDALESMEGYDVVFMDVTMPVMNGWEATEEIRKLERDHGVGGPAQQQRCVVVAVTGNTLSADVDRSLDAGMDDVFFKPYKIEYFRDAMQAAMDR